MRRSKIEKRIEKMLKEEYKKIKHNIIINGNEIDLYIPAINLYIQIDGVYWHGLNCERREQLLLTESLRDLNIYHTYQKDRRQDRWFRKNKMKLLRIKDTTAKELLESSERLVGVINSFLKSSKYVKLV